MQKSVFSTSEINKLNNDINKLLSLNFEDQELYNLVKKRTQILIYMIPQKYFYLPAEDCSEFFLEINEEIDKIIKSYKLSLNLCYIAYLVQSVKLKTKLYIRKKKFISFKKNAVIYNLLSSKEAYHIDNYNSEDNDVEKAKYNPLITLKEIYSFIVLHVPAFKYFELREENELYLYLLKNTNRQNLLIYIINSTSNFDIFYQKNLALIFDIDESIIANLCSKLHDIKNQTMVKDYTKDNEIIANHWARYISLENSYNLEDDDLKRKELLFQKNIALHHLRKKQSLIKNNNKGLSYRTIASELDISISKVAYCIKHVKRTIESIELHIYNTQMLPFNEVEKKCLVKL